MLVLELNREVRLTSFIIQENDADALAKIVGLLYKMREKLSVKTKGGKIDNCMNNMILRLYAESYLFILCDEITLRSQMYIT